MPHQRYSARLRSALRTTTQFQSGAIAIEWVVQKEKDRALKAGWGVLIGTLWGTVLKLAVSGTMAYYYIQGLW